jgi:hypothetical protein
MWRPRDITALALAVLVFAAGCGGDDGDDEGGAPEPQRTETREAGGGGGEPVGDRGGREAAEAFVACFDESGYIDEVLPPSSTSDPNEVIARSEGYDVASVFIRSEEGAFKSAWVTFFASEAKREEAVRELDLNFGSAEVPEGDFSRSAGVMYTTRDAREAMKEPIERCIG